MIRAAYIQRERKTQCWGQNTREFIAWLGTPELEIIWMSADRPASHQEKVMIAMSILSARMSIAWRWRLSLKRSGWRQRCSRCQPSFDPCGSWCSICSRRWEWFQRSPESQWRWRWVLQSFPRRDDDLRSLERISVDLRSPRGSKRGNRMMIRPGKRSCVRSMWLTVINAMPIIPSATVFRVT